MVIIQPIIKGTLYKLKKTETEKDNLFYSDWFIGFF